MTVADAMTEILTARFAPLHLEVIDESHRHAGHAGARPGGETHFRVRIATRHFDGKTRIAQHRAVMEALDAQIKGGVHALAIEVLPSTGPFSLPDSI
jgi:BolA family transcriptional regulator, general stress-responsive regulator